MVDVSIGFALFLSQSMFVPDDLFFLAAWHAIRENDFSIIDFTFLSPALVDLITQCMRAEPEERPTMSDLIVHPILERARALGKDALAPEDDHWLPRILANATPTVTAASASDVDMTLA